MEGEGEGAGVTNGAVCPCPCPCPCLPSFACAFVAEAEDSRDGFGAEVEGDKPDPAEPSNPQNSTAFTFHWHAAQSTNCARRRAAGSEGSGSGMGAAQIAHFSICEQKEERRGVSASAWGSECMERRWGWGWGRRLLVLEHLHLRPLILWL